MKYFLAFLFLVSFAAAQSVGQYELRKRGASGFTSYGVTLSNGQVIGLTADVPAAITPLAAGNNLSDLGSASTARTNLGLGAAALLGASAGGYGVLDDGKVSIYNSIGELKVAGINFKSSGGGNVEIYAASTAANLAHIIPVNGGGTFITTVNLTDITATGTITSGTWNGTAIGLGYIAQGGATSGQVLAWNGSAWAPAASGGGITIGTTTTSGASANDLLISNGTVVQKITPGTGVASALANAVNAASGLLTYSIIGTSGATVPLLNTANTFSATQTIAPSSAATPLTLTGGTVTTALPVLDMTQTWNAGGVTFTGMKMTVTETARAANSTYLQVLGGSAGTANRVKFYNLSATNTNSEVSMQLGSGSFEPILKGGSSTFLGQLFISRSDISDRAFVTMGNDGSTAGMIVSSDGILGFSPTASASGSFALNGADIRLQREAAATLQMGVDANAAATDQTFKAADGITGTDRDGGDMTIASGNSTGSGSSAIIFSTPAAGGTGTTARTASERARITSAGVTIGSGGAAISKVLTATATLDFGSTAAGTVSDLTVTVTGAAVGDIVDIGVPHGSTVAAGSFSAWVSATNTVTIRFANNALVTAYDPASGTFRATVIQH